MAYSRFTWVDDDGSGTVGTLYSATRMNAIEKGIADLNPSHDVASQSAAGTGTLTWEHTPLLRPRGVLVLIVQNVGATDEVTTVKYGGVEMEELKNSPFLHTAGAEDGVIYAYFLGKGIPRGEAETVTVTVSGASSKRAVAISMGGPGDLRAEATTVVDTEAGGTTPSSTVSTANGVDSLIYAALHSGAEEPALMGSSVPMVTLFGHDFGTQSALWSRREVNGVGGTTSLGFTVSSSLPLGIFSVAIAPVRDFGLVTALPNIAGKGDHCAFIADATNGVVWDLVFDGEGSFPWKKIGGPPLMNRKNNATARNNEAYGTLAEPNEITVPLTGDYDITIAGKMFTNAATRIGFLSYKVGATAANDEWAIEAFDSAGSVTAVDSLTTRQTGVAKSAVIQDAARTVGEIQYSRRRLFVDPVRVG